MANAVERADAKFLDEPRHAVFVGSDTWGPEEYDHTWRAHRFAKQIIGRNQARIPRVIEDQTVRRFDAIDDAVEETGVADAAAIDRIFSVHDRFVQRRLLGNCDDMVEYLAPKDRREFGSERGKHGGVTRDRQLEQYAQQCDQLILAIVQSAAGAAGAPRRG